MAPTQPSQQDFVDLDDIDLFTNTDFFDFDLNVPADLSFTQSQQQQQQQQSQPQQQPQIDGTDFQSAYYQPIAPFPTAASAAGSLPPSPPNGLPLAGQLQQSQPTVPSAAQFSSLLVNPSPIAPPQGQKRKASAAPVVDLEEQSRVAAEEDKRRRNTAASARFRVKKKQREQALEQTAKEMTDRVAVLEARVGQLETENKWLKGLLTEKDVDIAGGPPAEQVVETS